MRRRLWPRRVARTGEVLRLRRIKADPEPESRSCDHSRSFDHPASRVRARLDIVTVASPARSLGGGCSTARVSIWAESEMRTAFVLGGTGFVGRAITSVLRDAGWSVTVGRRTSEPLPEDIEGSVGDVVTLDRNDDDELAAALAEGMDVLVDTIPYRARDGSQLVAMKDRVGSLIAISTVSVYSDDDQRSLDEARSDEDFPDFPDPILETQVTVRPGDETYSTRKAAIEEVLLEQDEVPATVIRPGAIYGPHDTQCREWFFVKRVLDRRPVVILGYGGRTVFHPTSVRNLAELVRLAAETPGTRVLNCGDPSPPDALGIERRIAAAMGHEWTEVLLPPRLSLTSVGRTPWSGPKSVVLDMSAAREELGYRAVTGYPEAVGEVCDWVTAATQDSDWRAILPRAAEYLGTRFDYDAEDQLLATLGRIRGSKVR